MKKLILILVAIQLLVFSIYAQTSSDDKENLKKLNLEVVSKFKAGKIDDALILAKQAVDLGLKVSAEDDETAAAYFNLGTLYRLKKKYKEAAENLQKALSIYQLKSDKNGKLLAKTLEGLAAVYGLDGDEKKAAENYTLAFSAAEAAFGKDSKELLPYLKSMSDVYVYDKNYDKAVETFVRRYKITSKNSPGDSERTQEIEDEFHCFVHQYFKLEEALEKEKTFREAIQTEEEKKKLSELAAKSTTKKGGVVNSRATNLVKPEYPASARGRRAQGAVSVRITIDEKGNVTEARAICGDKDLRIAAENAAKKSKFKPTILSGEAIKVTGVIVYNFVAGY